MPILRKHVHFLRFLYDGRTYEFRCLPFGLSTAPKVFTRIAKAVASILRKWSVQIFVYLDDWLIVGRSRDEAMKAVQLTQELALRLGFLINQT